MGMWGGRVVCVRGGAGAGAETRGGEGSKRLVADGLARSATGRTCAHTLFQLNFFFFLSNFFFLLVRTLSFHHSHRSARFVVVPTVFRRHYASVGRLGLVPTTPRRITENRRPTRRGDHRERGRSVGSRPLFRWRCPRRCVNLTPPPLSPQSTILLFNPTPERRPPFLSQPSLPFPFFFSIHFISAVYERLGLAWLTRTPPLSKPKKARVWACRSTLKITSTYSNSAFPTPIAQISKLSSTARMVGR